MAKHKAHKETTTATKKKRLFVKATAVGYYGDQRRRPGERSKHGVPDQFELKSEAHFTPAWMEAVGWVPEWKQKWTDAGHENPAEAGSTHTEEEVEDEVKPEIQDGQGENVI